MTDTIRSVINLKRENIHFIIIDGASEDGTVDIIRKYSSYISYWKSQSDKGIYYAMNEGWKLAKKDSYVLFLGSGDEILSLPNDLKNDYSKVYYGNVFIGDRVFKSTHNFKLKLGSTLHHQALLIPKALSEEPPFDTKFKLYADFDFNQRLLKRKVEFVYSDEFKSYALPGGASSNRVNSEMLNIVRKNFGVVAQIIAYLYYSIQKIKTTFK